MAGCSLPTSGYSRYCDTHKRRNRRHGHPAQSPVTTKELAPFGEIIQRRIEKNRENPTWDMLPQRWSAILGHADAMLMKFHAGTPMNRYEIDAWYNLKKIREAASDIEVNETVLAMYLYEGHNPHRFKSHEAFGSQIVRRVRALAPVNAGSYYDHQTGASKKVYRDAKPKTIQSWLTFSIGPLEPLGWPWKILRGRMQRRSMLNERLSTKHLLSSHENYKREQPVGPFDGH